ncbi:MAG: HTH-type transcriptional regulator MalT [Aeromonadaceae bacterium]
MRFKISLPRAHPQVVSRARLGSPLSSPSDPALWLLSAPAGYGKSTLAREWCQQMKGHTGWYSLDLSDNDPVRFFSHLYGALQLARLGELSADGAPAPNQPLEAYLPALLQLMNRDETPLLLVLDDYHVIQEGRIHELLRQLILHLPPHVKLVITSRLLPPLGVAGLQVKGVANCIEARHLQFTQQEAKHFFQLELSQELAPEVSLAVWSQLAGWPGGLKLFCLLARERASSALAEALEVNPQAVNSYLSEEVFNELPGRVCDFLLATSVLEWFDEPLACLVADLPTCREELDFLERNGLFIVRVDGEQHSYRYQAVFGDFLRQRLGREPQRKREVHLRACDALLARQRIVEAMRHAERAEESVRLAAILDQHGAALMQQGQYLLVRNQLQSLPRRVIEQNPLLLLMRTRCAIYDYDMDYFSGTLAETEEWLPRLPIGAQQAMHQEMTLLKAQLALKREQWDMADRLAAQVLSQLQPEQQRELAIGLAVRGEVCICQGQCEAALEQLSHSLTLAYAQKAHINVVWQLSQLAEAHITLAQLVRAEERLQQAEAEGKAQQLEQLQVMEFVYRCWCKLALLRQDLPKAEFCLERMASIIEGEEERWYYPLYSGRLQLAVRQERLLEAQHWATELERLGGRYQVHADWRANADSARLDLWLRTGQLAVLRDWVRQQAPIWQAENHFLQQLGINRVRGLLGLGKYRMALRQLASLQEQARSRQLPLFEQQLALYQALALLGLGRDLEAREVVQPALEAAERSGCVGPWLLNGERLHPLLRQLQQEREWPFLRYLLLEAGAPRESSSQSTAVMLAQELPAAARRLALTQKEWQVLRGIANGLSNEQIADGMYVAHCTVKSHIRRIYRKLQVENREQAISRACQLPDALQPQA